MVGAGRPREGLTKGAQSTEHNLRPGKALLIQDTAWHCSN